MCTEDQKEAACADSAACKLVVLDSFFWHIALDLATVEAPLRSIQGSNAL